ncbi:protein-(glutamine-N5) methyltransferase, release factor-specific [Pacificimonas flava]|uniref:Release factor glutamine methyltransferase n=2 Tax=Pacificimonas TaxID=1960290 RepID=A0A219B4K8_9SPHN|nr:MULTISPECIES: peptide chain release factor N(5)-glutamine methyltransferase [Pacificimonas]MBZ6379525.1 peptide chain release factor N(5)-glutamine methyltransferase [Pacificimonas aurantium]OWV33287.1 protein-(glutamine-N5) methyltransferase, release factor-specific [Pacificimonas flava]
MSVPDQLRAATQRLKTGAAPDTARLDAELLAAHVARCSREELLLRPPARLDEDAYEALLTRRAGGEPVAHLTGRAEFWSLPLQCGPQALVPRADSESLVELALDLRKGRPPETILDLGTGTGALLFAALSEFRGAQGLGLDISAEAVELACRNAVRLQLADRASFLIGSWETLERGAFDLILCNPPYIRETDELGAGVREYEPRGALFAGADGLTEYRAIFPRLRSLLSPGGHAVFEIGAGQAEDVEALAARANLSNAGRCQDLGGHVRALAFTLGKG